MKTVEFEKCLRLIGYEEHNDESVISELLSSDISPVKYCDPFKKELNNNLFLIKSRQNKIDAIKYYILELYSKSDFLRNNCELLFTGSLDTIFGPIEHTSETGEKIQLNEFGRYIVGCRTLYGILFGIMEDSCLTYNLPFQKLCKDLNVDITHYDVSNFKKEKSLLEESKDQGNKNKLKLTEIGVLCYYNNRKVTIDNDIAIAREYGAITKKHIVNDWFNMADGNTLKPDFIERTKALFHIHRLEHILESGYLSIDKKTLVEKDIRELKIVAENKK